MQSFPTLSLLFALSIFIPTALTIPTAQAAGNDGQPIAGVEKPLAAKKEVEVLGEVNREGAIPFPRNGKLTLRTAVAIAGGLTNLASGKVTLILKGEKPKTYNLKELEKKKKVIELKPGDTLTAKERLF